MWSNCLLDLGTDSLVGSMIKTLYNLTVYDTNRGKKRKALTHQVPVTWGSNPCREEPVGSIRKGHARKAHCIPDCKIPTTGHSSDTVIPCISTRVIFQMAVSKLRRHCAITTREIDNLQATKQSTIKPTGRHDKGGEGEGASHYLGYAHSLDLWKTWQTSPTTGMPGTIYSGANTQMPSYGVLPKGLLTFLGSLYKEVAKTTSGTLVYRFERQTARENISSFEKHCVLDLECRISGTFR